MVRRPFVDPFDRASAVVDPVVVLLAAIELDDEVLVKLFHPLVAELGEPRLSRLFVDQQLFMDEPANGQQKSIIPSVAIKLHLLEQPAIQRVIIHLTKPSATASLALRHPGAAGADAWMRAALDYLGLGELIAAMEKYCGSFWTGMLVRLAFLVGFIALLHFGLIWSFSIPLHKVVWGAISAFDQLPDLIESKKIAQVVILLLQIPLGFVVAALIVMVADRVAGRAALPIVLKNIEEAERKADQRMAAADAKMAEAERMFGEAEARKQEHEKKPQSLQPEKRTHTHRSVGEILTTVRDMTSMAMDGFVQPHIGKWIRVQSVVRDIAQDDNSYTVLLGRVLLDPMVWLSFTKDEWPEIATMTQGKRLAAEGRITRIDRLAFYMDCCEIVELEEKDDVLRSA